MPLTALEHRTLDTPLDQTKQTPLFIIEHKSYKLWAYCGRSQTCCAKRPTRLRSANASCLLTWATKITYETAALPKNNGHSDPDVDTHPRHTNTLYRVHHRVEKPFKPLASSWGARRPFRTPTISKVATKPNLSKIWISLRHASCEWRVQWRLELSDEWRQGVASLWKASRLNSPVSVK